MPSPHLTAGSQPHAAAQRAADLIAALRGDDHECVDRVRAVLIEHGEPGPVSISRHDLPGLRDAAAAVHEIFAAPDASAAAAAINAVFGRYATAPRLTDHGDTAWHLHVDRDDDGAWDEWFGAASTLALAVLLAAWQEPPGRICAAPGCGRPFLTHGPGTPRRYCSARCATRMRVARHRGLADRAPDGP